MLEFGTRMWGRKTFQSWMMVRACYPTYLGYVRRVVDKPGYSCVVAGSEGTGKSFFGLLWLLEMLTEKRIVLYEIGACRTLLVPSGADAELLAVVNAQLVHLSVSGGPIGLDGGAFDFSLPEELGTFQHLATATGGIDLIQDIGEGTSPGHFINNGNARQVVLTSPDKEKIGRLGVGMSTAETLFMPTWSWEELEAANGLPHLVASPPDSQVCAKSPEELRALYDLFGGVPRNVLRRKDPRAMVEAAISDLMLEDLRTMTTLFTRGEYRQIPRVGPGLECLVRFEPASTETFEDAQVGRVDVASRAVLTKIQEYMREKNVGDVPGILHGDRQVL